jgi:hypothetical protein
MQSSPLPYFLIPLGPKYFPQHPILGATSVRVLASLSDTKFHTHIQNNRQNYRFVYRNCYIFGWKTGKQKMQNRMVAVIPRVQSAVNVSLKAILIGWYCPRLFDLCHTPRLFISFICRTLRLIDVKIWFCQHFLLD